MAASTKALSGIGKHLPVPEVKPTRKDRVRLLAQALDSAKTVDERTEVLEALLELRAE